jgi:aryl-alcohol dehydrogenase-like predicted oxidoreductase
VRSDFDINGGSAMKATNDPSGRRRFVGLAGLGLGGALVPREAGPDEAPGPAARRPLERRRLGRNGPEVAVLALGAVMDADNQVPYLAAYDMGIRCWDTANVYGNGASEIGIGRFLAAHPPARKDVVIISKSSIFGEEGPGSHAVVRAEELDRRLELSFRRMNTDYVDVYYGVHELVGVDQLSDEVRRWAERAKGDGRIRQFGISTHRSKKELLEISRFDWVDVVQTIYSFRAQRDPEVREAVAACHASGKGVVAMKVIGHGPEANRPEDAGLLAHFLARGLTPGQAKVKAVIEDTSVTTACVGMKDVDQIAANVEAASDGRKLTDADDRALAEYARATLGNYCGGCDDLCDNADTRCVSQVLRQLMYFNSYGQETRAREAFRRLPAAVREELARLEMDAAERRCPHGVPVRQRVAEALTRLA